MFNVRQKDLKMIRESKVFFPDPEKVRKTNTGSIEAFNELLKESWENPEKFWDDVARELHWFHPWEKTVEGDLPHFRYFVGGVMNPAYNMLDVNVGKGYGNKVALIWEGEDYSVKFYTYRMLLAEVNRFANVLKSMGLRKGDRVAIYMPNFAETVIAILACYRLGIIFNTVFSGFSVKALKDRLDAYEPQVLITADGGFRRGKFIPLKNNVDEAIRDIDGIKAVVVVNRSDSDVSMKPHRDYWWDELIEKASPVCDPEPIEANEPGLVFYTSGTTGKPKGVVHSGVAFTVNNYVYAKYHMDHHPDDMFWCAADIGWLTMHIWGIVGALTNGVTTIFYEGSIDHPEPDRMYEIIEKYRVNKLFTTPTAIRLMMKFGEEYLRKHDLSSLDVVSLVGEPLNPEVWYWLYEKMGNKKIYINNTYGQTETAGCPVAGAAWLTTMKPGSCGIQFLGAKMEVVDDEGKPVPPMTVGNLVMKRPIPMLVRTLWKEPERYIQQYFSQVEGAYYTYDAALKDNDGHFWVLARTDDVINVAGHRLSTMEIESASVMTEGVAEAAVIGMPDPVKGTVPVVFVTLSEGYEPSEEMRQKIVDNITEQISKIAQPAQVIFTHTMPKTPSGKILRRLLKEIMLDGTVKSDITGLENPEAIEEIKRIIELNDNGNGR